jgi:hypothetical protein
LEREGKRVRTCFHGRHFLDLPFGDITIEGISIVKHCTTAATREKSKDKKGLEKKRGIALFKNRISAATQKEKRREIESQK